MPEAFVRARPQPDAVITRAVLRAASNLAISKKILARILGVSAASVSRLGRERAIDPASKEGELALLFLRMARSLDAIVGGSDEAAAAWLAADNRHLGGVPLELIQGVAGLARVADYLDALRGRL